MEDALAIRRELGEGKTGAVAAILNNLGEVSRLRRNYGAARRYYEEALAIDEANGDSGGQASQFSNLGIVELEQGNPDAARDRVRASLRLTRQMEDLWAALERLTVFAGIESTSGYAVRAVRLAGAARALGDRLQEHLPATDQANAERWMRPARAALTAAEWDEAWAAGAAMSYEEAIAYALEDEPT